MVTLVGGVHAAKTAPAVSALKARGIVVASDAFLISSLSLAEKELNASLDRVEAEYGPLNSVVLSFDEGETRALLRHSDTSDWINTVTEPLLAAFHVCQVIMPRLIKQRSGGSVVFILSDYVMQAENIPSAIAVAQSALFELAKSLAREFGSEAIRVNCVGVRRQLAERTERQCERLGAILEFLLSKRSAYVTGQFLRLSAMGVASGPSLTSSEPIRHHTSF